MTTQKLEEKAEIELLLRSGKKLASMLGTYRPVSDRIFLERALQLANMRSYVEFGALYAHFELGHGTVEYSTEEELKGSTEQTVRDIARNFTDEKIGQIWKELTEELYVEYQHEQKKFVAVLEAIHKDRRGALKKYEAMVAKKLESVVCIGYAAFKAGRLLDKARPYLEGIHQVWTYAAALLLDEEQPASDPKRSFGERLRRCVRGEDEGAQYQCNKWFLSYAGEGGGQMKKYCSDECTALAALSASAARQGKFRKQVAVRKPK